jgi:hypothetical protein
VWSVVAFRETVKRLARNEFLGDLPFEFDATGTVLGHGFHPLKAPQLPVNSKPVRCPPSGAHSTINLMGAKMSPFDHVTIDPAL